MVDFNGQAQEAEPRSLAEAIAQLDARHERKRREKEAQAAAKAAEDRQRQQARAVVKHRRPAADALPTRANFITGLVTYLKEDIWNPIDKRLAALEAATGLSKTAQRPGVEAIAPVLKNYIDAQLAPIRQLVHELDGDAMRYTDVYKSGRTYKRGETCTHNGGLWLCLACTDTKPGTGDWKLVVKSGAFGPRDGGDAK